MNRRSTLTLAGFLTILTVATAHAGTAVLLSPPLPPGVSGIAYAACYAVNTGPKPVSVTVEIFSADSNSVVGGSAPAILNPGGVVGAGTMGAPGTSYCRVTGLSAKTGRLNYLYFDNSNKPIMNVTAP